MKLNQDFIQMLNRATVLQHPNFAGVLDTILAHVKYGCNGQLLAVIGPSGVGKTTVRDFAARKLTEYVLNNPECGYSPPIVLEAFAPEGGYFSWKAFYQDALRRMGEPEVGNRIRIDKAIEQLKAGVKPAFNRSHFTLGDLRYFFEARIAQLRPIAVFIDEIQGIAVCRSAFKKSDNLDVIKSMSNSKTTNYIILGTYEAKDMLYYGGQLARRVQILHFERYKKCNAIFKHACKQLIKAIDLPLSDGLEDNHTYFFNHTMGCMGIYISWVSQAAELAIQRGLQVVSAREFKDSCLSNIQLQALAKEIYYFEREHSSSKEFDPEAYFAQMQGDWQLHSRLEPRQGAGRPGRRLPRRDPVGKEGLL
jgi:hypothetical protein